jgi:hypothetical protein
MRPWRADGSRRWHFWPTFVLASLLLGPFAGPVGLAIWLEAAWIWFLISVWS